jgi:hypothetical protein
MIDFEKIEGNVLPAQKTSDIFTSINLGSKPNYVIRPFVYLTKHSVEAEDDMI